MVWVLVFRRCGWRRLCFKLVLKREEHKRSLLRQFATQHRRHAQRSSALAVVGLNNLNAGTHVASNSIDGKVIIEGLRGVEMAQAVERVFVAEAVAFDACQLQHDI